MTGFAWARAEVIATEGSANAPKDSVNPLATVRLVNFLSRHQCLLLETVQFALTGIDRLVRRAGDALDPFLAEIRFDHIRVADDSIRLAGGDDPPVIKHVEMVDQPHHRLHRVLDD